MKLTGTICPPGDKSISHRIALISLISKGKSVVKNFSTARDCKTSLTAVRDLGVPIEEIPGAILIEGVDRDISSKCYLDCQNSGTTMRLLMGILSANRGEFLLDGDTSLRNRPMERVAIPLRAMGANITCSPSGTPPVRIVGGTLNGIDYELPTPSAQLKSAIIFAGMQARGKTNIIERTTSRDHTEILLRNCGANIEKTPLGWAVSRSVPTLPAEYYVPGDISSAFFFICAATILQGSDIKVEKVLLNPTRIGALRVLQRMGASIQSTVEMNSNNTSTGSFGEVYGDIQAKFIGELKSFEVSTEETPLLVDEVPILALVATQAKGTSIFHDVSELRIKESDRVQAIMTQLNSMGAQIEACGNSLLIHGPTRLLAKQTMESFADHRIAMTLKIAGLLSDSFPTIRDQDCIAISYPNFDETLRSLAT